MPIFIFSRVRYPCEKWVIMLLRLVSFVFLVWVFFAIWFIVFLLNFLVCFLTHLVLSLL